MRRKLLTNEAVEKAGKEDERLPWSGAASESSSHCELRSISLHPPLSINCSAAAAAAVTTGNGANL